MKPPTVDTTKYKNISEIDLPLITICPLEQTNNTRLKELGYKSVQKLIRGYTKCEEKPFVSWGKSVNMTFDEILEQVFDDNLANEITYINGGKKTGYHEKIIYMPSFGYCKELSGYSPLKTMFINTQSIPSSIFITDPRYKNYYSLDFASHQGAEISSMP